jgi:hypothetical protein
MIKSIKTEPIEAKNDEQVNSGNGERVLSSARRKFDPAIWNRISPPNDLTSTTLATVQITPGNTHVNTKLVKQYKCSECVFISDSHLSILQHMQLKHGLTAYKRERLSHNNHGQNAESRTTSRRKHKHFKCELCDYRDNQKSHIVSHMCCVHKV